MITMCGCFGTIAIGSAISSLGASPRNIGRIIAVFISGAHFISVIAWEKARREQVKDMKKEESLALANA
jgi:hypothetical protein